MSEINPMTSEHFQQLSVLGEGSFGKVFLVRKLKGENAELLYALKVIKKQALKVSDRVRAKRERDILVQISHPFIVQLHYAFQTEGKLYLVLDFLRGGDLFTRLTREHRIEEEDARFYLAQILLALEYMHLLGIVYRDLKPENVMLDMEGHIKLIDLGLSKQLMSSDTNTYSMCGTTEYMAPEIISRKGHSFAVDFWSMAILMYEMLIGKLPFEGKDRKHIQRKVLTARLILPKYLSPNAHHLLKSLLKRIPEHRLGYGPKGHKQIKQHYFFRGINWELLYQRKISPPFKPVINEDLTNNFDSKYTEQIPTDSVARYSSSNDPFEGFSFNCMELV